MRVSFPEAESLLISYSGGKDSLALLDLAVKSGKHVEAFFLYFIPGMDYTAYWTGLARKRWGVKVYEYLHWNLMDYLRGGLFRHDVLANRGIRFTMKDVERRVRADSGIEWIGYGYKSTDSLQRRGMLNAWHEGIAPPNGRYGKRFASLKHWNDNDVCSYLSFHKLPIPSTGGIGRRMNGISLTPEGLEWMRDTWPDDYKRVLKVFPYAAAHADRAPFIREQKAHEEAAKAAQRAVQRAVQRSIRAADKASNLCLPAGAPVAGEGGSL